MNVHNHHHSGFRCRVHFRRLYILLPVLVLYVLVNHHLFVITKLYDSSSNTIQQQSNGLSSSLIGLKDEIRRRSIYDTIEDEESAINGFKQHGVADGVDQTTSIPIPRFLMGIMSHNKYQMERERRNVIRKTYLNLYKTLAELDFMQSQQQQQQNNNSTIQEKDLSLMYPYYNRICSLRDVLDGKILISSDNQNCQLIYTFVLGSGTEISTNYTNRTSLATKQEGLSIIHSSQMLVQEVDVDTSSDQAAETDLLHFNIIENGKQGKSPTWFKYAAMLLDEQQEKVFHHNVQFIIKTDSDTLLYPNRFFRWIHSQIFRSHNVTSMDSESETTTKASRQAKRSNTLIQFLQRGTRSSAEQQQQQRQHEDDILVYGGSPFTKQMCGWPSHVHCGNLTAPIYMGGAFHFLSVDLAKWVVTQSQTPQVVLPFVPHEDVTTGNLVFAHTKLQKYMRTTSGSITTSMSEEELKHSKSYDANDIIVFTNPDAYLEMWRHPVKDPTRYYNLWRKFLSSRKKRQKKTRQTKQ